MVAPTPTNNLSAFGLLSGSCHCLLMTSLSSTNPNWSRNPNSYIPFLHFWCHVRNSDFSICPLETSRNLRCTVCCRGTHKYVFYEKTMSESPLCILVWNLLPVCTMCNLVNHTHSPQSLFLQAAQSGSWLNLWQANIEQVGWSQPGGLHRADFRVVGAQCQFETCWTRPPPPEAFFLFCAVWVPLGGYSWRHGWRRCSGCKVQPLQFLHHHLQLEPSRGAHTYTQVPSEQDGDKAAETAA